MDECLCAVTGTKRDDEGCGLGVVAVGVGGWVGGGGVKVGRDVDLTAGMRWHVTPNPAVKFSEDSNQPSRLPSRLLVVSSHRFFSS